MAHASRSGSQRYFGLPVNNEKLVIDRIVDALFPDAKNQVADLRLLPQNGVSIISGRFEVILGQDSVWALAAFHARMRAVIEEAERAKSTGALVLVIDLGKRRAEDLEDYEAFRNVMKVHAAIGTLRLFGSTLDEENSDMLERTSAWSRDPAVPHNASPNVELWNHARRRIAVAVHGLPRELKDRIYQKAAAEAGI